MDVVVAVAIGVAIMAFGVWAVRLVASPPPPPPGEDDLRPVRVHYRCSLCGMQLTVTQVAGDDADAPRHCREDMEPITAP